ncbi:MAG: aminotransferase class V-fold PLP-dependent enzyme [Phycisphaerae bacterium]|nr:aminotransferase class V-fold PLP-dependent enzyme [Phycisphaerae bacterium]
MKSIDHAEYQELFSALEPLVWVAHSGVSPMSRPVAEAMQAFVQDVQENAAMHLCDWVGNIKELKLLAGSLLNAAPSDLAVTPNTTHGINLIAHGLRWRPGDQVIVGSKEYPANVYPWWAQQEARGVEIVWIHPDEQGRIPVEAYAEKITDRTRLLTVSHVQFASGYRHDLTRLGAVCKQAGVIFLVDAIQSFGVFPIDVQTDHIDALSTGCQKWLCGPTGVALFYTTPELRDKLEFTWVGANSVVDASNYLDYRFELLGDARRFENAMVNFPGIAGARAALEVVQAFGRERVEQEIHKATDRLAAVVADLGFTIHSSRADDEWSGIVALTHPEIDSDDLAERLKKDSVIATVRAGKLRLAPHAYHTEEHFQRITEALTKCVRQGAAKV